MILAGSAMYLWQKSLILMIRERYAEDNIGGVKNSEASNNQ